MREFCQVDDCIERIHRKGLCRAHYERKVRGTDLDKRKKVKLGSWESVCDAMHDYFHAGHDSEYHAARSRLRRAITAWATRRA